MIYFVNQYLMALNTSIEHTEIKRIKLFNQFNIPAKLITRDFNPLLKDNLTNVGLTESQMINMYDYFRDTMVFEPKVIKNYDLPISKDYDINPGANVSQVVKGSQIVMDVHHVPGTFGHVYYINYFDYLGNIVKRRDYDSRGFIARDQFYSKEGLVVYEAHYDKKQKIKIENYFDDQGVVIRTILHNYKKKTYYFKDETELSSFFLDELNRIDKLNAVFIADRPTISYDMIMGMKTRGKNILYMPNHHTVDDSDGIYANMNGLYTNAIYNNPDKWDKIIVATQKQKADLNKWYGGKSPIEIDIVSPSIQINQKRDTILDENTRHQDNKIIYTGKLDKKNNVEEIVESFQSVVSKLPDATLDIYGYGTEYANIQNKIKELNLSESVRLKGYQADLRTAYQSAELLVYAGNVDVEPLCLIEAMSYSIPCIAYKSLYAIDTIISDYENGLIIEPHNILKMESAMVKLLTNKKRLRKMSQNAYQTSNDYSSDKMIQKWQSVLN